MSIQDDCFENEKNHGFHDGSIFNYLKPSKQDIHVFYRKVALLHKEIRELVESFRRNELEVHCDKSIPLSYRHEELADIQIRLYTLASFLEVDLEAVTKIKHEYNKKNS